MLTIPNSWLHKKLIEPKYTSLVGMCTINNFILITMKCWQKNFRKSLEWLFSMKNVWKYDFQSKFKFLIAKVFKILSCTLELTQITSCLIAIASRWPENSHFRDNCYLIFVYNWFYLLYSRLNNFQRYLKEPLTNVISVLLSSFIYYRCINIFLSIKHIISSI